MAAPPIDPRTEFSLTMRRGLEFQHDASVVLHRLSECAGRAEWRELLRGIPDPQRLEHFGQKIYSQNDEDGIISEILRRLGYTPQDGMFVDIGVESGLECNTLLLLYRSFPGLWLEGSANEVARAHQKFHGPLSSGALRIKHAFVTAENIDSILGEQCQGKPVTLLSIDIDGNDFWVWKAIHSVAPAVVVVEYNAKFPPPISIVQAYHPDFVWQGTDYFGASITALARLAAIKGYRLVGCNITGVNAFFVRADLVADHFPYALTAENLYQPCRYHMEHDCFRTFGHAPDFGPYVNIDEDLSGISDGGLPPP